MPAACAAGDPHGMIALHDGHGVRSVPRVSARDAGQRARTPRDRGLRRGRAGGRVRLAALRGGRGGPARPGARHSSRHCRRSPRRLRGGVRLQGISLHRRVPELWPRRAWAATSPPGGELYLALRAGSIPRASISTATPSQRPSFDRRSRRGSATSCSTRSMTWTVLEGLYGAEAGRRPPAGPAARDSRRGRLDASRHLHRAGGFQVRVLDGRGGSGDCPVCGRAARRWSWRGCTVHIGSQLLELEPFVAAIEAHGEHSGAFRSTTSGAGSARPIRRRRTRRRRRSRLAERRRGRAPSPRPGHADRA